MQTAEVTFYILVKTQKICLLINANIYIYTLTQL